MTVLHRMSEYGIRFVAVSVAVAVAVEVFVAVAVVVAVTVWVTVGTDRLTISSQTSHDQVATGSRPVHDR